ncbi:2-oxoadipate dioxygenase/decarboxylase family protein [Rhodococcus sp. JS3073]|uniref:2-oxoadipate dioxygenase/decarboxylase family protein n=1 Tax=Rhodococcus sp. JS3073 TaxID=3002901 RepID=UPI003FA6BD44
MVETWELRSRFAGALAASYGREVPAYNTLVDVAGAVNADFAARNPADAERRGGLARVTAERRGAIRLGGPTELRQAAILFAGFGMHPVGCYDLRGASAPAPVVSTAFRPVDPIELARNPFGMCTSMLTTADRRFFDCDRQHRLENALAARTVFPTELLHLAALATEEGGLTPPAGSASSPGRKPNSRRGGWRTSPTGSPAGNTSRSPSASRTSSPRRWAPASSTYRGSPKHSAGPCTTRSRSTDSSRIEPERGQHREPSRPRGVVPPRRGSTDQVWCRDHRRRWTARRAHTDHRDRTAQGDRE